MAHATAIQLGTDDYREGAISRLEDALGLRATGRWVGAVYLAGRAVESMLRSLVCLKTKEQTSGHDLRQLLKRVWELGLLREGDAAGLDSINNIAVLWHNNLRFYGPRAYRRHLHRVRYDRRDMLGRRVLGDPVKANALQFLGTCETLGSSRRHNMAALSKKIERVIRDHLREGRAVDLEFLSDKRLTGHIISSEFRGKTYAKRRDRIDAVLAEHLTPRERARVGLLLTYTPEEHDVGVEV